MSDILHRPSDLYTRSDNKHTDQTERMLDLESQELSLAVIGTARTVLQDKRLTKREKVQKITSSVIKAYSKTLESPASHTHDPLVHKAVDFAFYIWERRKDETVANELEVVKEGLEKFENISPIHLADTLHNSERLHEIMEISALATRMWVLDQLDEYTAEAITPSEFVKRRERAYKATSSGLNPGFP